MIKQRSGHGTGRIIAKHLHQFDNEFGAGYSGSPIINLIIYRWQEIYHTTKANKDIVGLAMSLPTATNQIIWLCVVMRSADRS